MVFKTETKHSDGRTDGHVTGIIDHFTHICLILVTQTMLETSYFCSELIQLIAWGICIRCKQSARKRDSSPVTRQTHVTRGQKADFHYLLSYGVRNTSASGCHNSLSKSSNPILYPTQGKILSMAFNSITLNVLKRESYYETQKAEID
jgi:hypothetical protein